jgi:acyl dehydratase
MILTVITAVTAVSLVLGLQRVVRRAARLSVVRARNHALKVSPNELDMLDVTILLMKFVFRAVIIKFGLLPSLGSRLLATASERNVFYDYGSHSRRFLPEYKLTMPLRVTRSDVLKYSTAVQQRYELPVSTQDAHALLSDPAHMSLFLSAVTEPAFLILLSQPECPIQPLGSVNMRNSFYLRDVDGATNLVFALVAKASASSDEQITVQASFESMKAVKRGVEVDIIVTIHKGLTADLSSIIFSQTFTMLEFQSWPQHLSPEAHQATADSSSNKEFSDGPELPSKAFSGPNPTVQMSLDDPRQWAALCYDYNPIHHVFLAAKLGGFRGRLAHGNHVAARAIETLRERGSVWTRAKSSPQSKATFALNVTFRRPVTVPSVLELLPTDAISGHTSGRQHLRSFDLLCAGKVVVHVGFEARNDVGRSAMSETGDRVET